MKAKDLWVTEPSAMQAGTQLHPTALFATQIQESKKLQLLHLFLSISNTNTNTHGVKKGYKMNCTTFAILIAKMSAVFLLKQKEKHHVVK